MALFHYNFFFVTCIFTTIVVDSAYVQHSSPIVRRSCCNNSKRRGLIFQEPRSPSLEEILAIAKENHRSTVLQPEDDPLTVANEKLGLVDSPPVFMNDDGVKNMENQKAYLCSKIQCDGTKYSTGPVCACNFNTGNVVTFKNKCDLTKHNCRFNTGFKMILNDICPWEFESRRREPGARKFDYTDPKYYN